MKSEKTYEFICLNCGEKSTGTGRRKQICSACRGRHDENKGIIGTMIRCVDCGKEIVCKCSRQQRCSDCAKKRRSEQTRERRLRLKQEAQEQPKKSVTKISKDIGRISVEARALGLSYGKYVTLMRSGTLDVWLKEHRIDFKAAVAEELRRIREERKGVDMFRLRPYIRQSF